MAEGPQVLTQYRIAREAYNHAHGNVSNAVESIVKRLKRDEALFAELVDPMLYDAASRWVHTIKTRERQKSWTAYYGNAFKDEKDRARASADAAMGVLMNFPLPSGKLLRDANRDDVSAAVNQFENQGKNMLQKAHWLRLVLQCITGKKTVGSSLTENRLLELQNQAKKDVS